MYFTDVFIRRPVFSSALSLMLLVIGFVSFYIMPVMQYPLIQTNVVTVTTTYPGASAELMAGFVTTPLENAVGSIDGIDYMTSSSSQNTSQITVNLQLSYPIETAVTDTANEVNSVRWMLPKDIQDPVITKQDPNATPIVYIAFNSSVMSSEAVTDYLLRVVQPQMQTLDGVSQAQILGERQYAMRLNLNSERMAALNITANDFMIALQQHNLQAAAGTIQAPLQQFNVVANTDMSTPEQFDNMVIKKQENYIIRLRDIGNAVLGAENYNSSAVVNGQNTTVVGVIPTTEANPLAVSQEVEKLMPSIKKELPEGITADVVYDSSIFIAESIHEVYVTMIESSICVIIVIFLFLGSLRSVFIPIVTIPLSIVGVCSIMLALNYSINTITLLAWVLAIGLVVDDAIVVLENVHRHMDEGMAPIPASIIGAREIGFAIVAMTLTLAAVYAPIGFTGGLTGMLFSEFAFTLAAAVVVSGFVALTLSPMMCSRMLRHEAVKKGLALYVDTQFEKIMHHYQSILRSVLKFRYFIAGGAVVLYSILFYLMLTLPQQLAPTEDQGVVLVYVDGPSPANILYTEKYTSMINPIFNVVPEMQSYGVINGYSGTNTAMSFLSLIPWGDRDRSAMTIADSLFPKLWAIPGLKVIPITPPPLPNAGSFFPLQFVIKTVDASSQGIARLNEAMQALIVAANENPGFLGVDPDLKIDNPQIYVDIDRNKAGDLGVSMDEISSALNILFGSPTNIQFAIQGRGYYVIPELASNFNFKASPNELNNVYVRSEKGEVIPLSNMITIKEQVVPLSINHFQQLTSTTLSANLAQNYPLGTALEYLTDFINTNYPDLQTDTAGQARQFVEAQGAMTMVLVFALVFIFLVLAAQFESYRDPTIVLSVVPLTLAGALIVLDVTGMLHLTSGTLNIYSKIGLVTLVGLIAKHGILIVEFSNQLQLKGYDRTEAVIRGASLRLRPILMTTGAMILGAIPLAIASGAGSAARNDIGWVIVGGMAIGTLFSLFVVPAFYSMLAQVKKPDEELERQIREAIEYSERKKTEEHHVEGNHQA